MFIRPILPLLKEQQVKPEDTTFLGLVEDNNDPLKLGRLKVRIEPYSEMTTEQLPWACPVLGTHGNSAEYGGLNVPELGSQVRLSFPSKDLNAPYYSGAELNKVNRTTFFDDDYPHTYGYKDSIGNFVKINKERGTAQFQHNSTTNLQVAPDGSIKVGLAGGAFFIFDNGKNFDLNLGTLDISGSADGSLEVQANNEINLKASTFNIAGDVIIQGDFKPMNGASGSFITNGNFVEVTNGIITSIQ